MGCSSSTSSREISVVFQCISMICFELFEHMTSCARLCSDNETIIGLPISTKAQTLVTSQITAPFHHFWLIFAQLDDYSYNANSASFASSMLIASLHQ
jgi:hypothetical protein